MTNNINITSLKKEELLSVNGGTDCPLDANNTAHSIGESVGYILGIAVGSVLVAAKIILEKAVK
jgi:hypothetical protein